MIKPKDKAEFIGQVIDIFEDFLDEKDVIIPNDDRDKNPDYNPENLVNFYGRDYDTVKEKLEHLFRSWKVLKDDRPLIDYRFEISINGKRCEGSISVEATDPEDAYQKAEDEVANRLYASFSELDIEYDINPVEDEGYPIYRISSKRNHFDAAVTETETTDIERAKGLFQMLVSDNEEVWLHIRTSKSAGWSTIQWYPKE